MNIETNFQMLGEQLCYYELNFFKFLMLIFIDIKNLLCFKSAVPNLFQPWTPYKHSVDPLPLTVIHLVDPLQPYVDPRLGTTALSSTHRRARTTYSITITSIR